MKLMESEKMERWRLILCNWQLTSRMFLRRSLKGVWVGAKAKKDTLGRPDQHHQSVSGCPSLASASALAPVPLPTKQGLWSAIDIHGSGHRINRRSSSSVARPALALLQVRRRRYEDGQKEALSKKKNSKNRAKKKTKQKTKKKKKLRGDPRREI
ncbi:hypothetical protein TEQG_02339 [Trichophyton equinum CBS 127.97]|uniref:Uncharacterized protein n=1 Tax=Trichophyton equinum (strain ATCC MYA-4606 / CBS 127.97) TaxID=559882 RepID=F2PN37_TRIEC|nr:hypothetical protein TEQG_02339 [Trichophyton equinum CBS 127.97]